MNNSIKNIIKTIAQNKVANFLNALGFACSANQYVDSYEAIEKFKTKFSLFNFNLSFFFKFIILTSLLTYLSFSVNAQNNVSNRQTKIITTQSKNANLSASNVIFNCQCIVNKVMAKKGVKALKMNEVAQILGTELFTQFEKAILLFNAKRLIFKSVHGKNELSTSNSIMKLKYGKRFSNLATYVSFKYNEAKTIINLTTNKEVKIYNSKDLISYKERISNNYQNNMTYTK